MVPLLGTEGDDDDLENGNHNYDNNAVSIESPPRMDDKADNGRMKDAVTALIVSQWLMPLLLPTLLLLNGAMDSIREVSSIPGGGDDTGTRDGGVMSLRLTSILIFLSTCVNVIFILMIMFLSAIMATFPPGGCSFFIPTMFWACVQLLCDVCFQWNGPADTPSAYIHALEFPVHVFFSVIVYPFALMYILMWCRQQQHNNNNNNGILSEVLAFLQKGPQMTVGLVAGYVLATMMVVITGLFPPLVSTLVFCFAAATMAAKALPN